MADKITKSDAEWRQELPPERYHVLREKGTEPAFGNAYWNNKQPGVYHCAACHRALFDAQAKYDSGTGWPSFWTPVDPEAVSTAVDHSGGRTRTEITCSRCGSHLGHVFEDGPEPTGLRYCLNSAALELVPEGPAEGGGQSTER